VAVLNAFCTVCQGWVLVPGLLSLPVGDTQWVHDCASAGCQPPERMTNPSNTLAVTNVLLNENLSTSLYMVSLLMMDMGSNLAG
jgi:hypothetical protein